MGRSDTHIRRMCFYCSVGGLGFSLEYSSERLRLPDNFKPFVVEAPVTEQLFNLTISSAGFDNRDIGFPPLYVDAQEPDMPRLEFYHNANRWIVFMAVHRDADCCARIESNEEWSDATLYLRDTAHDFAINNATMLLYAISGLKYNVLEMHASVIIRGDYGYLFLGKSGTGKSTHSRLWQEAFDDAWLLNDDNPVIRIEKDGLYVYGTPWSGKTPCYKNKRSQVGAFVQLYQAPDNHIEECRPSKAFSLIYSSCSGLKFIPESRETLYDIIVQTVNRVKCYELYCLPNHDAAYLCCESVSIKST